MRKSKSSKSKFISPLALPVALGLALVLSAPARAGTVDVKFVDAEHYDNGLSTSEKSDTLRSLADHMRMLGQKNLPADETLKIEVLDVELAGHSPATGGITSPRIVHSGADTPRIHLRYALTGHGGQVLKHGDETLTDLDFQGAEGGSNARVDDPLHYEKHMLDKWFASEVAPLHSAQR